MVEVPKPVEISLPARDRVIRYTWLDELRLAFLNDDAQGTRNAYTREPSDWALLDVLACQLVGLSAGRMAQRRGYDAREYLIEAEEAVLRARKILRSGAWNIWVDERFVVLWAVIQFNMAVLCYETGNRGPGQDYLQHVRDNLASLTMTPNRFADDLCASLTAEVNAFDEYIATGRAWE